MGIQIRKAVREDIPSIHSIYNDAIANSTAVYSYEPVPLEERLLWFETKQQQNFPIFVALDALEVVGFSSYGPFRSWDAYLHTVENSVYVAPKHRGQGVGKLLLPPLIDDARARGMHTIIAGIDAANIASIRLHARFGFVQVAHFKEVGFKFNRWLDLVFMELLLDNR
jgi:L-amino acid N-acyltransferase YncA